MSLVAQCRECGDPLHPSRMLWCSTECHYAADVRRALRTNNLYRVTLGPKGGQGGDTYEVEVGSKTDREAIARARAETARVTSYSVEDLDLIHIELVPE